MNNIPCDTFTQTLYFFKIFLSTAKANSQTTPDDMKVTALKGDHLRPPFK